MISMLVMTVGLSGLMLLMLLVFKHSILSLAQCLMQLVDLPTLFLNKSDQHASSLDLFLTSSPTSSPPLGNLDHTVVAIDISFQSTIKQELPMHKTSFRYQHADWGTLRDCIAPLIAIFNLPIENCAIQGFFLGQILASMFLHLLENTR